MGVNLKYEMIFFQYLKEVAGEKGDFARGMAWVLFKYNKHPVIVVNHAWKQH